MLIYFFLGISLIAMCTSLALIYKIWWLRRFKSDIEIIGRALRENGEPFTEFTTKGLCNVVHVENFKMKTFKTSEKYGSESWIKFLYKEVKTLRTTPEYRDFWFSSKAERLQALHTVLQKKATFLGFNILNLV